MARSIRGFKTIGKYAYGFQGWAITICEAMKRKTRECLTETMTNGHQF